MAVELSVVIAAIAPTLTRQSALRVRTGHDEGFGRAMKILVSVVGPSVELTDLLQRLVVALGRAGAQFDDPEFVGPGYRAHVTMTRSDRVRPGDPLHLRQAAVVDMEPAGTARLRKVVQVFTLGPAVSTPPAAPTR